MKKIKLVLMIIFIFILFYFIGQFINIRRLNTAIPIKHSTVTKILFVDARGFNKPLTVTDPEKIEEFMRYLNKCVIADYRSPMPSPTGWVYSATFYNNEAKIDDITFGNPITINNQKRYYVIFNNLSIERITKYLKTIVPSWNTDYNNTAIK